MEEDLIAAAIAVAPGYAARLVLRPYYDASKQETPLLMVVGVVHGDPRHPDSVRSAPLSDELLFCRIIFDPIQRFTEGPKGHGADGLLTSGGIYPGEWGRQIEGDPWIGRGHGQPRYDPYK